MFTVREIAKLAGITRRTLHYYDEIGLLTPSRIGDNGYRYYGEEELVRLQQILLYRAMDMPLDDIKTIMGRRDFDVLCALEQHRAELDKRIGQMEQLKETVDQTILHLKGQHKMSAKQFFQGFSEKEQAEYEQEAAQTFDPATVQASAKKYNAYSTAEKERIGTEGNAAYQAFVDAMPKGAESAEAQAAVTRWRRHIEYFWTPSNEQLVGLADGYNEDARFKANFDKIHPDLADFVRQAVKVYVAAEK